MKSELRLLQDNQAKKEKNDPSLNIVYCRVQKMRMFFLLVSLDMYFAEHHKRDIAPVYIEIRAYTCHPVSGGNCETNYSPI